MCKYLSTSLVSNLGAWPTFTFFVFSCPLCSDVYANHIHPTHQRFKLTGTAYGHLAMVSFDGLNNSHYRSQLDGRDCPTCGKELTSRTATTFCPCCSRVCCAQCVEAECTVVSNEAPFKVCINCYPMLQTYRNRSTLNILPLYTLSGAASPPTRESGEIKRRVSSTHASVTAAVVRPVIPDAETRRNAAQNVNKDRKATFPNPRAYQGCNIANKVCDATKLTPRCASYEAKTCTPLRLKERSSSTSKLEEEISHLKRQNSALNSKLQEFHAHAEVTQRKMEYIVNQTQLRDVVVHTLQKRVADYQEEVTRLKQQQLSLGSIGAAPPILSSARLLRPSLVQPIILSVVPPKDVSLREGINLSSWAFDTMEIASLVPSALQSIALAIVKRWNLFSTTEELQKWSHMVAALENNYRANPFHNALRAADVLQAVFSLVSTHKPLMKYVTLLELKALVFATVALDVRHPGYTNDFLVRTCDPLCHRHPGPGTLEQMHVDTAFHLLEVPELNFTYRMSEASLLKFKAIVAHLINRTDYAAHSEHLEHWSAKARDGGFDYGSMDDRVDALSLLLVAADFSANTRGPEIAKKWLVVIEEHAAQAEEERRRGLSVTPGFELPTSVERSQMVFLDSVVIPLFDKVQQLFPGVVEPSQNLRILRTRYAAWAHAKPTDSPPSSYDGGGVRRRDLGSPDEMRQNYHIVGRGSVDNHASCDMWQQSTPDRPARPAFGARTVQASSKSERLTSSESIQSNACWTEGTRMTGSECLSTSLDNRLDDGRSPAPSPAPGLHNPGFTTGERNGCIGRFVQRIAPSRTLDATVPQILDKPKPTRLTDQGVVNHQRERVAPFPARGTTSLKSQQWDGDERLARKYYEMDDLLLHVRAMRVDGGVVKDGEEKHRQLHNTLAEREAAITEAAELLRLRRTYIQSGGSLGNSAVLQGRLETAITQLKAAATLLAK
uniref:Putative 3', 5'-cyclic nucleotide phosphodiesterase n=1 Tax=Trypanosoma congolense (strain IL3000) TaxID=1068625 RepID=G0UK63_TRYCI|nr:putative 3', 5'-cyclic nucleotide phosphodiesterase [Trypanosoma congolense IL3000]